MSKKQFEEFLDAKNEEEKSTPAVDWNARKQEWLSSLEDLYGQVEQWLSTYIDSGKIKMERSTISLDEDYLGTYTAAMRVLHVGHARITLRPIGTLLIGASGRVDMEGPKGRVRFIRTGKNSTGITVSVTVVSGKKQTKTSSRKLPSREEQVWKIATPPPQVRFIELTSDSFYDALMSVVNG